MERVRVSWDGARVGYLDKGNLHLLDTVTGTVHIAGGHVDDYAFDHSGEVVAWTSSGRLHRLDRDGVHELPTPGPARLAAPDPSGRSIAYLTGDDLRVIGPDGADELLAGEPDGVRWGEPEPYAGHFGRDEGWWWAPDGQSILAVRRLGDQISLHVLDLDGGWVDVHWDRDIYPYLGAVSWYSGPPLLTVLRRTQSHGLVLAADRRTGETQVHAELADPRWVHPVPGTPRHLADGRVLVGGEIAHDGYDARCLFADGTLLTPPALYVRRVVGRLGPGAAEGELGDLLVEGTEGEPSEQHLFRVRSSTSGGLVVHRFTSTPGWHVAECGGDTIVAGARSLAHEGTTWTVWRGGALVAELNAPAPVAATVPRPSMERVTDRRLPAAVLYPPGHVLGRRLPVLLHLADEPTAQQVRNDHEAMSPLRRWTASGFAVVVVDGRGTAGVAPSYEKITHRRVLELALNDQVDGVHALAEKHPDLDLTRVAALGAGYGGWLAAALALHRPGTVRLAVAVAPWDWEVLPLPVAERYLGLSEPDREVFARHALDYGARPDDILVLPAADHARAADFLRTRLA